MSAYPNIKLDEYYFVDEGNLFDRTFRWMELKLIDPIMPFSAYVPSIYRRKKALLSVRPGFRDVAKLIGLYDTETEAFLDRQNRRINLFLILLFSSELILSMILFLPLWYGFFGILLMLARLNITINGALSLLGFFALIFLIYRVAFNISTFLLERKFADTLCLMQINYILLELTRQDVIRSRKDDLLNRMNFLSNKLILMGTNYSGSDEVNEKWTYDHFNKISRFVRERERLVIAPTENTLEQLRQDLFRLGKIIASGQYGSFDFQVNEAEKMDQRPKSLSKQIFTFIARVLSIAIPVYVLVFMLTSIEAFNQLNINRESVFYISVAWLLLALDDLIGIGIVEKILNLVKVSKELR